MALPPFKKKKSASAYSLKADPVPAKVSGSAKKNRNGGVTHDTFRSMVTDMAPRMPRRVGGK